MGSPPNRLSATTIHNHSDSPAKRNFQMIPITTNANARAAGIMAERQRILTMIINRMAQCTNHQNEATQQQSKLAFAAMWIELNDLKLSIQHPIVEP